MRNLLILSTLFFFSFAQAQTTGGPDAYGYTWTQMTAAQGAKWVEIANPLRPGTIDITDKIKKGRNIGPINFSFDFPFYWYTNNSLYINSLGYISFNPITIGYPIARIPRAGGQGDDFIGALITPLSFNSAQGKLYFWTDFKDSVIITYEDVPYFVTTTTNTGSNTFQIILSKADGNILLQYAKHQGSFANTPCPGTTPDSQEGNVPICQMIGIENNTGQVGLLHSVNDESFLVGISKTNPVAIKFSPNKVQEKAYSTNDLAVVWNNTPGNKGIFVSKGGVDLTLKSLIKNQGTGTSGKVFINGNLKLGNQSISKSKVQVLDALPADQEKLIVFDNTLKTKDEGIFSLETSITNNDADKYKTNDIKTQLISVVDTLGETTLLDYTNGESAGTGFTFLGATAQFDRGIGTYIKPSYYPCVIKTFNFGVNGYPTTANPPSDPVKIRIFNDYGTNVFNIRDGSPGDIIYEKTLIQNVDFTNGYNSIPVTDEIQINSGGVYIALMQGGQGISYIINNTAPSSFNAYEVNDPGGFLLYRERSSTDFLLGIEVAKGDISKAPNLKLAELLSPLESSVITDSTEVKIKMTNTGPIDIVGPFDVIFKADSKEEVVESIPASVTIKSKEDYIYTFQKKVGPPPQPRTQYNYFCARINPPNDFDLSDNQICYGVPTGVSSNFENYTLRIYPNPADNQLYVLTPRIISGETILNIKDINGKTIYSEKYDTNIHNLNAKQIDVSKFTKGIYFLSILNNNNSFSTKFIK